MPANPTRRLPADLMEAARDAPIGIQSLPNYMPANTTYSAARLADLGRAM